MEIDMARLEAHPQVMDYLVRLGLKNCLQDSHAGMTEKTEPDADKRLEKKQALASKKLEALYAGQVARIRTQSGDPVEREMAKLVEAAALAKLPKGKAKKDIQPEAWANFIAAIRAKDEAGFRAKAEAMVAAKATAVEAEVDEDIMALLG